MIQDYPKHAERLTAQQEKAVPQFAWVILILVYLATIAAPISQAKVSPILTVLMETFHIDLTQAGSITSVFAITGIILAFPAGVIVGRLGPKIAGLIALGCLTVGSAVGALSSNFGMLLGSRVVEGIGMGLLAVIGPIVVAAWFPKEKRGVPMGVIATWVPVGMLVTYLVVPFFATSFGWRSVWWFSAGYSALLMIFYGILMRLPRPTEIQAEYETGGNQKLELSEIRQALANRDIWFIALGMTCFGLITTSITTFYPTFLNEERGYSLAMASQISSVSTILFPFSAPFAGWLSDRLKSRKLVMIAPLIIFSGLLHIPFRATGWGIYTFMALMGLLGGAIPTATITAAVDVMRKPQWIGLGLGVIGMAQNLSTLVGPVFFGSLVESLGWANAGLWLIPFCGLALLLYWFVRIK